MIVLTGAGAFCSGGHLGSNARNGMFATNTFQLVRKTPEQFVQFIRDDLDNWARQIKAAGIQPD